MASILEELKKKQEGFTAAIKAVETTKPKPLVIEKSSIDNKDRVSLIYDPAYDTIEICVHGNSKRSRDSFRGISPTETRLIFEVLYDLFYEEER